MAPDGAEISVTSGTVNLNNYNLLGDSSKTTAQALSGVTPGRTDITATSDGTHPTALSSILDTTLADNGGPTHDARPAPRQPCHRRGRSRRRWPASTASRSTTSAAKDSTAWSGGRIDMGAFEVQPLEADFDKDGDTDGNDFLIWQAGFNSSAAMRRRTTAMPTGTAMSTEKTS